MTKPSDTKGTEGASLYFSSPCSLHETDPEYHGFLSEPDLITLLNELLITAKTIQQACAFSLKKPEFKEYEQPLQNIQKFAQKACESIPQSLFSLQAEISGIDPTPDSLITASNPDSRFRQIQQIQSAFIQRIQTALPQISYPNIHHALNWLINS
jgi:hypothetical protein